MELLCKRLGKKYETQKVTQIGYFSDTKAQVLTWNSFLQVRNLVKNALNCFDRFFSKWSVVIWHACLVFDRKLFCFEFFTRKIEKPVSVQILIIDWVNCGQNILFVWRDTHNLRWQRKGLSSFQILTQDLSQIRS